MKKKKGILHDGIRPDLMRIAKALDAAKRLRVRVGVQGEADSHLLMIARVHEYGATIRPKNVKNLAVPFHMDAKGKSPRDFPGLFFLELKESGAVYGCVKEGKGKIKFLFLLMKSSTIPERSFIRASYDNGKKQLESACERALLALIRGDASARDAAESIGGQAMAMTTAYFNSGLSPEKSNLARKTTTSRETLVDTGRLAGSITYQIEEV